MSLLRCLFLLFLPAFAVSSFASVEVQEALLPNGLTALVQPMPESEMVSIYAYVKAGSAVEGKLSGTGVSHFVEHMLFKGTSRRPTGAIAKEVRSLGGTINASTTLDYTMYTIDLPKDQFERGLDIISDMLINSVFDPQELEKERQVIQGEMRLYNDRPDRRLSEDVFQSVYLQHTYRHPIIGYPALFNGLTHEQVYKYYRTHYIPNNIVLSVAGGVDTAKALPLIKEAFKDFKPAPFLERVVPAEPPQVLPRRHTDHYPSPLWRFSLAYPSVSVVDPDLFALDVLAMALGQGNSSRLYAEIYKARHLVEEINAGNFTPQDKGIFWIEGVMSQDNLSQVTDAVKAMIADISRRGLTKAELQKTKRQVLSQFIFGNQTSAHRAWRTACDKGMTGDAQFSGRYVEAVKQLTNEDIKRVAQKYLTDTALNVTVLAPAGGQTAGEARPSKAAEPIEKMVLDNGLTILLREDHSSPTVAVNATVNAGLNQENAQHNGISQLLSQVWTTGTQTRSEIQIAQEMEDRGGALVGFAGRNSVGLRMQVLSEDLDFALDLLADLVQHPSFTQESLQDEKNAMNAAIDRRDDDIHEMGNKHLMKALFAEHMYAFPTLGSKESLARIDRTALLDYYRHFVQPSNMAIAVFGNFDRAKVAFQMRQKFGGLKNEKVRLEKSMAPKPLGRAQEVEVNKEQSVVMYGFLAPAIKAKDRWAMDVIDTVLGSGLSGRLFVKVRDELGKAYTVGSDYTPGIDVGSFVLFVLTTAEKVDSVKGIVDREIRTLQETSISDEELAAAKTYLKGTLKMGLSTPAAMAAMSVTNELYGLGYDFARTYDSRIDGVTKEDVLKAAATYLNPPNAAVVIMKGQHTPDHE